jgi:hypothetical protein
MIIQQVLKRYEKGTGQLISLPKYSLMFGTACDVDTQTMIASTPRVQSIGVEEKYLGLLVLEGRMKIDKFHKRMSDWSENYLSSGSKEVLIKSFMQALHAYAMGFFFNFLWVSVMISCILFQISGGVMRRISEKYTG